MLIISAMIECRAEVVVAIDEISSQEVSSQEVSSRERKFVLGEEG